AVIPIPQILPELLAHEDRAGPPASLLLAGDFDYGSDPGTPGDMLATRSAIGRQRDRGSSLEFLKLSAAQGELLSVKDWYERAESGGSVDVLRLGKGTEA